MTSEGPGDRERQENGGEAMPHVIVRNRARPSIVWLIPVVAAVVGLFLAYRAYTERGPTITITFDSAEGLEAGSTRVKFKEVDIGLVQAVELSEDLSQVVVTARLVAGAERYLTENTRFWVVRAVVSAGQISGLGTFLSGAYIAIDPATEGSQARRFDGLDKAPVVTSDVPGSIFNLRTETLGSIDVGSPVYYRRLQVGNVAGYELDLAGDQIQVQVFIESPHDQRVRSTTRFWNASGLDVVVSPEGVEIDTPSLVSMLVGGVAFETTATMDVARDVPGNMVFELYPNRQASKQPRYSFKSRFLLYFDESVSGLVPGSAVEFRGIKVGEVQDVKLEVEPVTREISIPVVIEIEPERLGLTGPVDADADIVYIEALVARGLRAQLKTASLITGRKAVEFTLVEDVAPASVRLGARYPELPTAPGSFDAITTRIGRIVGRFDQVPIESIGQNLDQVLVGLRETLVVMKSLAGTAQADLMPSLMASLGKLEETLESADTMIAPNSAMAQELEQLVLDLAGAAHSIRLLAERLEQHPEELLRGKEE